MTKDTTTKLIRVRPKRKDIGNMIKAGAMVISDINLTEKPTVISIFPQT